MYLRLVTNKQGWLLTTQGWLLHKPPARKGSLMHLLDVEKLQPKEISHHACPTFWALPLQHWYLGFVAHCDCTRLQELGVRFHVVAACCKPRDSGGVVSKAELPPASASALDTNRESQAWEWRNCCSQRNGDEGKADLQDRVCCKKDYFKKAFEFLVQPRNDVGLGETPQQFGIPCPLHLGLPRYFVQVQIPT